MDMKSSARGQRPKVSYAQMLMRDAPVEQLRAYSVLTNQSKSFQASLDNAAALLVDGIHRILLEEDS